MICLSSGLLINVQVGYICKNMLKSSDYVSCENTKLLVNKSYLYKLKIYFILNTIET